MGRMWARGDAGRAVGRKVGSCCVPLRGQEMGPHLIQCRLGRSVRPSYQEWHPDPSSRLAIIDMGRKVGGIFSIAKNFTEATALQKISAIGSGHCGRNKYTLEVGVYLFGGKLLLTFFIQRLQTFFLFLSRFIRFNVFFLFLGNVFFIYA